MKNKIYLYLSILTLILSIFPVLFSSLQHKAFLSFSLLALALLFFFLYKNLKKTFLFLLAFLPLTFYFNQFKFNLSFLTYYLNLPGFSVYASFIFYIFFIVVALIFIFQKKTNVTEIPLFFPIICLALFFSSTILWSPYPQTSLSRIIFFLAPLASFFGAYFIFKKENDFFKLNLAILISAIPPSIIGFYQILTGNYFFEPDSALGRITGTFFHPNNFALYLFLVISLGITFVSSFKKNTEKNIKNTTTIFLALFTFMLIFTFSRTSWLLLLFFCLLFFFKKKHLFRVMAISALLLAMLFSFTPTQERLEGIYKRSLFDSVYVREMIFKMGLEKTQENPWLGYGIGNFEEVIKDVKESSEGSAFPHNDFSLFALEGGLIALALFSWLLIVTLIKLINIYKKTKENTSYFNSKNFIRGVLIIFILTFFVAGMVEAVTTKTVMQIILWSILGFVFAFNNKLNPE